ncbi:MAG: lamin tail domain-containing protein [Solirubrobacteraceae bacterium]
MFLVSRGRLEKAKIRLYRGRMFQRLLPILVLGLLSGSAQATTQNAEVLRKGGVNDGDTIIVRLNGRTEVIRFLGVQAFELSTYNNNDPTRWRGECHSVPAARFVLRTIKRAGYRVRLSSPAPRTDTRGRLIRQVDVRLDGRWRDLEQMLLRRGLVMWLHHVAEAGLNRRYSLAQQTAAAKGVGIFRSSACGAGPRQDASFELRIMSDPIGEDTDRNGEWVRITNTGAQAVSLGGWSLGNAGPKAERFRFPAGAGIAAGGSVTVFNGAGTTGVTAFYRDLDHNLFENSDNGNGAGDGAYLLDPDGDVRAHTVYPCLLACSDPNQGALQVRANPIRGPEYVLIRNVSDHPVDLHRYQLRIKGAYPFGPESVLAPGEAMQVFVKGDPSEDTRLVRHIGYDGAYMNDGGGSARVATYDEIDLACDAWGSGRC